MSVIEKEPSIGDGIERFVSFRLSVLSRLINRRSTRYFADEYGLTLAEWRCLVQVAIHPSALVRDISERTYADKGQVSRAAASLSRKGLIKGVGDPDDRRSVRYKTTSKGQRLYEEILEMRVAENQAVLDLLSPEQQSVFIDCLDILMANFATGGDIASEGMD